MSVTILKQCVHFLGSNKEKYKLVVLEIINAGISLLSEHDDQLLPLIHEIWSPLVWRFSPTNQEQFKILRQSFRVLTNLAKFGKEFIRQRTVKSILPLILNYLKQSSDIYKRIKLEDFKHNQAFKLQHEILENLGEFVNDLRLDEKCRHDIMVASMEYLHKDQPQVLQESARKVYLNLFDENHFDVCYFLARVWPLAFLNNRIHSQMDQNLRSNILIMEQSIANALKLEESSN